MNLIVWLGNRGPKYQMTRLNVGFLFIDALAEVFGGGRKFKSEFKSETQKIKVGGDDVLLCKPQTFMNLSGEAVQPLMSFYNIALPDLLVAHDEIDIPYGHMRFQIKRGAGGHNGVKSLHQHLGTDDYARLRLGVDRPPVPGPEVHAWVLQNFSSDEQTKMAEFFELAIQGVEVWNKQGLHPAATQFNGKSLEG
jgi:PTH1 family peptidyl-tRNA hydrolase